MKKCNLTILATICAFLSTVNFVRASNLSCEKGFQKPDYNKIQSELFDKLQNSKKDSPQFKLYQWELVESISPYLKKKINEIIVKNKSADPSLAEDMLQEIKILLLEPVTKWQAHQNVSLIGYLKNFINSRLHIMFFMYNESLSISNLSNYIQAKNLYDNGHSMDTILQKTKVSEQSLLSFIEYSTQKSKLHLDHLENKELILEKEHLVANSASIDSNSKLSNLELINNFVSHYFENSRNIEAFKLALYDRGKSTKNRKFNIDLNKYKNMISDLLEIWIQQEGIISKKDFQATFRRSHPALMYFVENSIITEFKLFSSKHLELNINLKNNLVSEINVNLNKHEETVKNLQLYLRDKNNSFPNSKVDRWIKDLEAINDDSTYDSLLLKIYIAKDRLNSIKNINTINPQFLLKNAIYHNSKNILNYLTLKSTLSEELKVLAQIYIWNLNYKAIFANRILMAYSYTRMLSSYENMTEWKNEIKNAEVNSIRNLEKLVDFKINIANEQILKSYVSQNNSTALIQNLNPLYLLLVKLNVRQLKIDSDVKQYLVLNLNILVASLKKDSKNEDAKKLQNFLSSWH